MRPTDDAPADPADDDDGIDAPVPDDERPVEPPHDAGLVPDEERPVPPESVEDD